MRGTKQLALLAALTPSSHPHMQLRMWRAGVRHVAWGKHAYSVSCEMNNLYARTCIRVSVCVVIAWLLLIGLIKRDCLAREAVVRAVNWLVALVQFVRLLLLLCLHTSAFFYISSLPSCCCLQSVVCGACFNTRTPVMHINFHLPPLTPPSSPLCHSGIGIDSWCDIAMEIFNSFRWKR